MILPVAVTNESLWSQLKLVILANPLERKLFPIWNVVTDDFFKWHVLKDVMSITSCKRFRFGETATWLFLSVYELQDAHFWSKRKRLQSVVMLFLFYVLTQKHIF